MDFTITYDRNGATGVPPRSTRWLILLKHKPTFLITQAIQLSLTGFSPTGILPPMDKAKSIIPATPLMSWQMLRSSPNGS